MTGSLPNTVNEFLYEVFALPRFKSMIVMSSRLTMLISSITMAILLHQIFSNFGGLLTVFLIFWISIPNTIYKVLLLILLAAVLAKPL